MKVVKKLRGHLVIGTLGLALVTLGSCGDDDDLLVDEELQEEPQLEPCPVESPAPSTCREPTCPSPPPRPQCRPPEPLWLKVKLRDESRIRLCKDADLLLIGYDGRYLVSGPCRRASDGRPIVRKFYGRIADWEREELRRRVEEALRSSVGDWVCDGGSYPGYESLSILTLDGRTTEIRRTFRGEGTCYRCDPRDAEMLWRELEEFKDRKYPGIPVPRPTLSPQPSPSATPSLSPTPSPSPIPSPSVSPSPSATPEMLSMHAASGEGPGGVA